MTSSERGTQAREAHPQALPTGEGVAVVMAASASRSDDVIARAILIHQLRWAAEGEFSVPLSPQDARRLLEEISA